MTSDEALDILWQIAALPGVPDYDKKRLVDVILFIESQEDALDHKHDALVTLVRRNLTLSGQLPPT
jgi:hypothetical protein